MKKTNFITLEKKFWKIFKFRCLSANKS